MRRYSALLLIVALLVSALAAPMASAEDWGVLYKNQLVQMKKTDAADHLKRAVALVDLDGDGTPEMAEVSLSKAGEAVLRVFCVSDGGAYSMSSSGAFSLGKTRLEGVTGVSMALRESKGGVPCLSVSLSARKGGAVGSHLIGLTAQGDTALSVAFYGSKLTKAGASAAYLNGEEVSASAFASAKKSYQSAYAKKGAVALKGIARTNGAAAIASKLAALIKKFNGTAEVAGVKLSPATLKLTVGETAQLTASVTPANALYPDVTYLSNKPGVCAVSDTGLVTAVAAGTATIAATTDSGAKGTCKVTVTKSAATKGMIVDISEHNATASLNWPVIAKNVDLLILRCGVTRTYTAPIGMGIDNKFKDYAAACARYNIPFGVYYYGKVSTAAEGRKEAKKTWAIASEYDPLFYVYDAEETMLTKAVIEAYVKELRALGAKKVGLYVANHLYGRYKLDASIADFMWIPSYGSNNGTPQTKPDYACDLWQYSSNGKVDGFGKVVDVNKLTGSKSLKWFLSK